MVSGLLGRVKSGKDEVGDMIMYLSTDLPEKSFDGYIKWKSEGKQGSPLKRKKFADSLKFMIANFLGVPVEMMEDREFKDRPIPYLEQKKLTFYCPLSNDNYTRNVSVRTNNYKHLIKPGYKLLGEEQIIVTPRWLMINIGTDAFRNIISTDWWVLMTFNDYDQYSKWIITDVRFQNESDMVKDFGGKVIGILRPFADAFPEYADLPNDNEFDIPTALLDVNPKLYRELTSVTEPTKQFIFINSTDLIYNTGSLEYLYSSVLEIFENEA